MPSSSSPGFPLASYMQNQGVTFSDLVYRLLSKRGTQSSEQMLMMLRVAVSDAFEDLVNRTFWKYYNRRVVLVTDAIQSYEDAVYDSSANSLTIASGTWPTNAIYGEIVRGTANRIRHRVLTRTSGTVLVLAPETLPTASFTEDVEWRRASYTLPYQIRRINAVIEESSLVEMTGISQNEMIRERRFNRTGSYPLFYCIRESDSVRGAMEMEITPVPSSQTRLEILANFRPRPLQVFEVTGTDGSFSQNGTTFTSATASFTSDLVGCSLKVSSTAALPKSKSTLVSSRVDYLYETTIEEVTSTTTLRVKDAFAAAGSSKGYVISDIADVHRGTMLGALEALAWEKYCLNHEAALSMLSLASSVASREMDRAMFADSTYTGEMDSPINASKPGAYRVGNVNTVS